MDVIQFLASLLDLHRQQLQALTRQGEIQAEVLAQLLEGEGCGTTHPSGPRERELRMPAMRRKEQSPEAYLAVFEQAAASSRLPRGEWGSRLARLLSEDVWAETYPAARSSTPDYDALKAKILSQARAVEDQSWLDFSSVRYDPLKGVRDLGLRLSTAAERWLRPERRTALQVVQRVALEQFVSLLPKEAKAWVHMEAPGTMEEAIRLAEEHLGVSNEEGPSPAQVRIELQTGTSHQVGKGSAEWRVKRDRMDVHETLTESFLHKHNAVNLCQSVSFSLEDQELADMYLEEEEGEGSVEDNSSEVEEAVEARSSYLPEPLEAGRKKTLIKSNQMPVFAVTEAGVPSPTSAPSQTPKRGSPASTSSQRAPEGPAAALQAPQTPLPLSLGPGTGESPDKRKYECPDCGRGYTKAGHLGRHRCSDAGDQTYICPRCDRAFASSKQLNHHLRMHEKPHGCPDCGKHFRDRYNLKCHRRTHTGERPHRCPDCGHAFAQERGLREHRNIHTGEKPFRCGECGKGFHHSRTLSKHCQLHSAERPYLCAQCGWTFKLKDSLKKHQQTHRKQKADSGGPGCPQGVPKRSEQSIEGVS